ncbi:hypothetical protein [Serinicoccus sp. CNJ-927]|uniref:hypothetical protein n=1 Tax=Serinicoccus sp. CNJ-927 TaxID=1904970 RepID=UPI0026CF2311|nr:hypothetical protein [Serinicoccus sp. CNJ-927]
MTSDAEPAADTAAAAVVSWRPDAYDDFAASYEAENVASLLNAFYARPAMVDLAATSTGAGSWTPGAGRGR